jgi:hypothetical protein
LYIRRQPVVRGSPCLSRHLSWNNGYSSRRNSSQLSVTRRYVSVDRVAWEMYSSASTSRRIPIGCGSCSSLKSTRCSTKDAGRDKGSLGQQAHATLSTETYRRVTLNLLELVAWQFVEERSDDGVVLISQHIKKDTDWLWELFLLEEYPLFHERCRESLCVFFRFLSG